MLRRLAFLISVLVSLLSWQSGASADPALWVLKDADSTIYLFGTIHVMKPGVAWQSPQIAAAFSASSELWVEEADDDNQAAMVRLAQHYGMDPAHPLSSKLTPAQRQQLATVAQQLKINPAALEPLRPWLATLQLVYVQMKQLGYDPDQGVDHGLRNAAKATNRRIRAFETSEQQIQIFARLSPQDELQNLAETLNDIDKGPDFIAQTLKDWLAGDIAALDKDISADMRTESPTLYRALFLDRNAVWTRQIEHLLAGKGTAFIAVGTGHLVGSDSVIAMLERDGFKVERQ